MCRTALGALLLLSPAAVIGWATPRSCHPRARAAALSRIVCIAPYAPSTECLELKDELLELIDEEVVKGSRGIGTPSDVTEDILEVVSEIDDDGNGAVEWNDNPALAGNWRLLYTSSRTFANNEGLSGYARDLTGVSTPELYMQIETTFRRVVYEEPLVLDEGSIAALFGKFANAESVKVECVWSATSAGVMAIASQRVVVGSNSWEPADRQDKAVRALAAGRPVLLDDEVLVLRSQPEYVVWVFERT